MAMGLGLTFGPLIGTIMYGLLDYTGTMFFFAFVVFSVGWVAIREIPLTLDED